MHRFAFILPIVMLLVSCTQSPKSYISKELNASWQFKESGTEKFLDATVPGNVHLDLEKNGIIDNPFYGTNEEKVQWIEKKDWVYKGTFQVDKNLKDYDNLELEFLGLDTYADVFLNGTKLFSSENMFIANKVDVSDILVLGENTLEITFHSPIKMAMPKFEASDIIYPADNDRSEEHLSVFTRKAPYHYGWDWGPRFVTSGIWRPIMINAWDDAKINDIYVVQQILNDDIAKLQFNYEISSEKAQEVSIAILNDGVTKKDSLVKLKKGINTVSLNVQIDKPKRWWPNGMGEAYLYNFTTNIKYQDNLLDSKLKRIGLRTIEVVNKPDSLGESFFVKVNGIPTFLKGANYIPNDSFLGRMTDSIYERNFNDAVRSNMNMLRVWGGGVYEDDRFYNLADEKGILIWQDFMFACTMYPSDDDFLANVEKEAEYNIKRLRNHASVALWCGNNEIQVGWDNWGWQDSYKYTADQQKELIEGYSKLFKELLPRKVKELDPARFYYHSSPISNWGNISDMKFGDNHYWGVWWGKKEFDSFNEYVPRFMSEFGFQSFPQMKTIESFSEKSDWNIDSEVMKSHQKSSIGNVTIKEYMQRDYKMPKNFEDFVYLNQIMQAEGMRIGFEAHRRNKPFNMGSLYWQFNDVWPVVSWSGIDYFGRWKAMQYFVKKSFEPVLATVEFDKKSVNFHLVSGLVKDETIKTRIKVIDLNGKTVFKKDADVLVNANDNKIISKVGYSKLMGGRSKKDLAIVFTIEYDDKIQENLYFFVKPKDLNLKKANIQISGNPTSFGHEIRLKSDKFVKNIELSSDTDFEFSDNYFDMIPNKEYIIELKGNSSRMDYKRDIRIKSVVDTY